MESARCAMCGAVSYRGFLRWSCRHPTVPPSHAHGSLSHAPSPWLPPTRIPAPLIQYSGTASTQRENTTPASVYHGRRLLSPDVLYLFIQFVGHASQEGLTATNFGRCHTSPRQLTNMFFCHGCPRKWLQNLQK
jgi:hypothetical protein